jgi:ABC-type Na+ efflux pump permease subunit
MRRVLTIAVTVWRELLRRKEIYVLLIMLAALLYALLSADIFGMGTTGRYVMDLGLLMAWIFTLVLTVSVSCRQLPDEEGRGTIYPLLAKPLTRGELLLGKWLGAWSIVSCASAVFYLMIAGVVKALGGSFEWQTLAQGWVVHLAGMAALSAAGIAFSTRMTSGASASLCYVAIACSFGILPRVPGMLVDARGVRATLLAALYYLFPHFELFDMRLRIVHEWGMVPWSSCAIVLSYGATLTALLLFVAWIGYRRKHFRRGAAW